MSIDGTGRFSGDAWGEWIGWIRFAGTALDMTNYQVATSPCGEGLVYRRDQ